MTRKDLASRRERLRELGKIDYANRCDYCRQARKQTVVLLGVGTFCSEACLESSRSVALAKQQERGR